MTKLLIALGSIAALALWILKRWFSKDARLQRLKDKERRLLYEFKMAVHTGSNAAHDKLLADLKRVRREIRRLSG